MAKRRAGPTLIQQSRRVPAEEKALYHQELGAGRSRVKRPFLGLTEDDAKAIEARLQAAVDKRIKDLA
jgi:phage gpG-like protein